MNTFIGLSQNSKLKLTAFDSQNQKTVDSIWLELNNKDINLLSIIKKAKSYGYFDSEILKLDTVSNSKNITIKLNKRITRLNIILKKRDLIYIPKNISAKNLIINTTIKDSEKILNDIANHIKDKGHQFFELKLSELEKMNASEVTCNLVINIKEDKKRTIDHIRIKGYDKFPKKFIKHYLKIKKKETLVVNNIKNKASKINSLGFAEQNKPPEILFTKDSTTLYLYLKKKKSNNFDGVIGFNSNEDSGKLEFTGNLNINLTNNFNTGEEIKLNYRSDENKQRFIDINIKTPYIFNQPISLQTELNIFTKDSSFTTTYFSEKAYTNINSNSLIGLGYENTTSKTNMDLSLNQEDFNTNKLFLDYNYKKESNKKITFAIYGKASQGRRSTSNTKENQTNLEAILNSTIKIYEKHYLNFKSTNKTLVSNNIIQNELYRFGGINSIRGFDENSIEANQLHLLNIEYLYRLGQTLNINTITDFGYFENKTINQKNKLYSFGLGLSTKTKSGLLKIIVANGKTERNKLKASNTKIHLSLQTFF